MPAKQSYPLTAKVSPGHPFFGIIEAAYRVFSSPKPKMTGVCERCCMDPEIEADFFTPKIAELPLVYVRDWYHGAYNPGEMPKETWTYLLPRILEILATGEELSSVGIEVSLNRFDTGNRQNWSSQEWRVLDQFQRAYLGREIESRTDFLDNTICMFGMAGWPLESLFDQVAAIPDEKLAERWWQDWCNCLPGRESIWITAFWESPGNSAAFDFYTSREMFDRMEALALADDTDQDLAAKALAVAGVIEKSANWRA